MGETFSNNDDTADDGSVDHDAPHSASPTSGREPTRSVSEPPLTHSNAHAYG